MSELFTIPVQKADLASKYWFDANFNPYGNPCLGDCVIRSFSAALMMKYKSICRRLGIGLKVGFGANVGDTGVILWKAVTAFRKYVALASQRLAGVKVADFINVCGKDPEYPYGIYLLETENHSVCVCAKSGSQKYFVDTWDCSVETVKYILRVKTQVSTGSSERLTLSEFRRTQKIYSDPSVQAKFRKLAKRN